MRVDGSSDGSNGLASSVAGRVIRIVSTPRRWDASVSAGPGSCGSYCTRGCMFHTVRWAEGSSRVRQAAISDRPT